MGYKKSGGKVTVNSMGRGVNLAKGGRIVYKDNGEQIGGNPTIDQLNKPGGFIYNAICNEGEDCSCSGIKVYNQDLTAGIDNKCFRNCDPAQNALNRVRNSRSNIQNINGRNNKVQIKDGIENSNKYNYCLCCLCSR